MANIRDQLYYILDKCGYIGLSKINGEFNLDFGGFCVQKDTSFDNVLAKSIELIDNWKGF